MEAAGAIDAADAAFAGPTAAVFPAASFSRSLHPLISKQPVIIAVIKRRIYFPCMAFGSIASYRSRRCPGSGRVLIQSGNFPSRCAELFDASGARTTFRSGLFAFTSGHIASSTAINWQIFVSSKTTIAAPVRCKYSRY